MATSWKQWPITQGVVTTRDANVLEPGESTQATNSRLVPGDEHRIHRDWKLEDIAAGFGAFPSHNYLIASEWISFEESTDPYVLVVTADDQSDYAVTLINADDGSATRLKSSRGGTAPTSASITHVGNEYFLGTNVGNFVIYWDSDAGAVAIRDMGLDPASSLGQFLDTIGGYPSTPLGFDGINLEFFNVHAYWHTYYDADTGVESGPSNVRYAITPDGQSAYWRANDLDAAQVLVRSMEASNNLIAKLTVQDIKRQVRYVEPTAVDRPMTQGELDLIVNDTVASKPPAGSGLGIRFYRGYVGAAIADIVPLSQATLPIQSTSGNGWGVSPNDPAIKYAERMVAGTAPLVGGLLADISAADVEAASGSIYTYSDKIVDSGVADPVQKYPLLTIEDRGGFAIYDYLRKPPEYTISTFFNERIARVDTSNLQVISASPVSDPEQQPIPYAVPIVTDRSDQIRALKSVRDLLLAFTQDGVLRVNYWPFDGFGNGRDQVVEVVARLHGAANGKAVTTFDSSEGQAAAWLSRDRLLMTDGIGWEDACPDWDVRSAGLGRIALQGARLINNPRDYRLELWHGYGEGEGTISFFNGAAYVGWRRWDFYYHPRLLKNGHLRAWGPTDFEGICQLELSQGVVGGKEYVYLTGFRGVGAEATPFTSRYSSSEYSEGEIEVDLAEIWHQGPSTDVTCEAVACHHSANPSQILKVGLRIAREGSGVREDVKSLKLDTDVKASRRKMENGSGRWIQPIIKQTSTQDDPIGPLWLLIGGRGGGNRSGS